MIFLILSNDLIYSTSITCKNVLTLFKSFMFFEVCNLAERIRVRLAIVEVDDSSH